jgi:uncharacterized protein YndB with AHSA1/START domain
MPTLAPETASTSAETFLLEQTRVIRAPRARVYEAWTNPEVLKLWFGPAGMYCPSVKLDVRVGGAYRIEVHPTPETAASLTTPESTARQAAAEGTYTRVVPNELLEFTWAPSWNPAEESLVTVSLKDADGGTQVTILHQRFTSEGSRDGHGKGWDGCLTKLAENLER